MSNGFETEQTARPVDTERDGAQSSGDVFMSNTVETEQAAKPVNTEVDMLVKNQMQVDS